MSILSQNCHPCLEYFQAASYHTTGISPQIRLVAEVGHLSGEAPSRLPVAFAAVSPTAIASQAADIKVARHEE
jgi:hypothetical protein